MSYSILRLERVKNKNDTTGIQKHVQRETENYTNLDIDKSKIGMNYDLILPEKIDFNEKIKKRLDDGYKGKRKIRSDAIKHVDGLITSDDKFFGNMSDSEVKQFFENSLDFLKSEYGEENMLYATVHIDEKTPHMHFGFVPLTSDGRLSAKDVLGNKKKMSMLQDKFNTFVNEKGYELERGESAIDTKRKHVDMNTFKQQTEFHKKEMEQIQQEFDTQLVKWGKLHDLSAKEERESFNTIVVPKAEKTMPTVEIRRKMFGGIEIDPKQIENLQEWGEDVVDLIKKQQNSMERKDREIKRLHDLVAVQEKEVDERVKNKYKKEIDQFNQREVKLLDKLDKQEERISKLVEINLENVDLQHENKVLRQWKEKAIAFMQRLKVYQSFQQLTKKISRNREDDFSL